MVCPKDTRNLIYSILSSYGSRHVCVYQHTPLPSIIVYKGPNEKGRRVHVRPKRKDQEGKRDWTNPLKTLRLSPPFHPLVHPVSILSEPPSKHSRHCTLLSTSLFLPEFLYNDIKI